MFLQNICIKWKISVILFYFNDPRNNGKFPTCDDYFFYCCCGSRDRHAESFPMPILGEGILWPFSNPLFLSALFGLGVWFSSFIGFFRDFGRSHYLHLPLHREILKEYNAIKRF
jgi:hypothetical protein